MDTNGYSSMASKQIALYISIFPLIFSFVIFLIALIEFDVLLIMLLILCWIPFCVLFLVYRNAFLRFEMDKYGIRTKYIFLKWEQISTFCIRDVDLLKYAWPLHNKIIFAPILCIGEVNGCGFVFQKRKKCIFISLTKKNVEMLKNFAGGKSSVIDGL